MRCNVGVNPIYLPDQFLVAEYRELVMLIGSLEYYNWEIKSNIPAVFTLGTGHMNFLKVRLRYIQRRHEVVKTECRRRGIRCELLTINIDNIDPRFCNDWQPTLTDSNKIRIRLNWKLLLNNKPEYFWRLNHEKLNNEKLIQVARNINYGELYHV